MREHESTTDYELLPDGGLRAYSPPMTPIVRASRRNPGHEERIQAHMERVQRELAELGEMENDATKYHQRRPQPESIAKVYEALSDLGPTSSRALSRATGLHLWVVLVCLRYLEAYGKVRRRATNAHLVYSVSDATICRGGSREKGGAHTSHG